MNTSISREQQTALNMLLQYLPEWQDSFSNEIDFDMITQNTFVFSDEPFAGLPQAEEWSWNKSNGVITVQLEEGMVVELQKMNARKKYSTPIPTLKIWLYKVGEATKSAHLFAFWCEIGFDSKRNKKFSIPSNINTNTPTTTTASDLAKTNEPPVSKETKEEESTEPDFSIKDFNFLAPFADPDVAMEFGWV